MKEADDPKLADLKKLLKRLEKIDPETRNTTSPSNGHEPAKATSKRLPDAKLDRPANDAEPVDGLLQLRPRKGSDTSRNRETAPSELPVIVKQSLPATTNSGNDPGAFHVVIIASITAAIVSALATAGTVYWLNLESNRLAYQAPAGGTAPAAVTAPSQHAAISSTVSPNPSRNAASQTVEPAQTVRQESASAEADAAGPGGSADNAPDTGAARHASVELAEPQRQPEAESEHGSVAAAAPGSQSEPDLAAAATPGTSSGLPETPPQEAEFDGITPPRPKLAGEPDHTALAEVGPAITGEAKPSSAAQDNASGPGQQLGQEPGQQPGLQLGEPQPAVAVASARELVAALTSSNAIAAESKGPSEIEETKPAAGSLGAATLIGPGERGALSSLAERETLNARAETKAPTVAVFDAPPEATPVDATPPAAGPPKAAPAAIAPSLDQPAAADAQEAVVIEEKVAIAASQVPPSPQLGPGEVALSHPAEVAIDAGETIQFPLAVLGADEELLGHYLIISGLKRGAYPSAGSELMFDTWRINLAELPGLKLSVPTGFARRLHLAAELRRPDGTTRETTTIVLTMPGAASGIVSESEEAAGLPAAVLRSVDEGEVQVDNGSLRAARLLFQRAAEAGSARAAMLLAATYDPNYVSAFKTLTPPVPDNAAARRWYKRAAELGAPGARERLQRLPGN